VFTVVHGEKLIALEVQKTGCSRQCLKTTKLILCINRTEIVKNFTNFACGAGAGPIKFWRSSNQFVSAAGFVRMFGDVHRFLQ